MTLSGPQALRSLEEALRDIRREEDEISKRLARSAERLTKIREGEAELFRQLASVRLDANTQAELSGRLGGSLHSSGRLADSLQLEAALRLQGQLRNQPLLPLGAGQMLQPPLPLRLYYLITPVSGTEAERQLLLGRVIQAFHDAPMISVLAGQPVGDSHGGGSPELRLVMDMLPPDEIFRLWQALGARQRLSVAYQLRGVVVDSARAPLPTARVGEAHVLVGQAGEGG